MKPALRENIFVKNFWVMCVRTVGNIFAGKKYDYPILEAMCKLKYDQGCDDVIGNITQALRDSNNAGYIDIYSVANLKKIRDQLGKNLFNDLS